MTNADTTQTETLITEIPAYAGLRVHAFRQGSFAYAVMRYDPQNPWACVTETSERIDDISKPGLCLRQSAELHILEAKKHMRRAALLKRAASLFERGESET